MDKCLTKGESNKAFPNNFKSKKVLIYIYIFLLRVSVTVELREKNETFMINNHKYINMIWKQV